MWEVFKKGCWLSTELRELRVPWEPWGTQTAAFKGPLILKGTQIFQGAQFTQDTDIFMRKALAYTEKLENDTECCLLKKCCSDMASDVETTDTENSLTVTVTEKPTLGY